MAGKYAHLVKPLNSSRMRERMRRRMEQGGPPIERPRFDVTKTGNSSNMYWLTGKDDLEGINLNFTWGFYGNLGEWHPGMDPHTHPYDECLVFVGLDPTDITYLGAELELSLGEECEVHTINRPTVVCIPKDFPHCPLVTKKVDSPKGFGFYLVCLNPEVVSNWLGPDIIKEKGEIPRTTGDKYSHLVKPFRMNFASLTGMDIPAGAGGPGRPPIPTRPGETAGPAGPGPVGAGGAGVGYDLGFDIEKGVMRPSIMGGVGPANADELVWMFGSDLEGFNVNFTWGFYSKTGIWHEGHGAHVHDVAEVLVFVGLDPNDIDYLGAELTIDMGKEHEQYTFDKPTVVICPAGLPHLPLITNKVEKPYSFYVISLDAEHYAPYVD